MRQWLKYILAGAFAAVAIVALLVLWVVYDTREFIYSDASLVPQTEVAIVPGASIIGTSTLSQILQNRADEALVLYNAGKVSKILVTGDNAALNYDEVEPVGKYLEVKGVPPQDIFLDHAGFDTYSSMYRAKVVFGVTNATIVSQAFHLPRAVFIARQLGIQAYGVDAVGGDAYNYEREVPAILKALWDLAVHRVPEYLGQQIPITGTGTSTQPALGEATSTQ